MTIEGYADLDATDLAGLRVESFPPLRFWRRRSSGRSASIPGSTPLSIHGTTTRGSESARDFRMGRSAASRSS